MLSFSAYRPSIHFRSRQTYGMQGLVGGIVLILAAWAAPAQSPSPDARPHAFTRADLSGTNPRNHPRLREVENALLAGQFSRALSDAEDFGLEARQLLRGSREVFAGSRGPCAA